CSLQPVAESDLLGSPPRELCLKRAGPRDAAADDAAAILARRAGAGAGVAGHAGGVAAALARWRAGGGVAPFAGVAAAAAANQGAAEGGAPDAAHAASVAAAAAVAHGTAAARPAAEDQREQEESHCGHGEPGAPQHILPHPEIMAGPGESQ